MARRVCKEKCETPTAPDDFYVKVPTSPNVEGNLATGAFGDD